jgi:Glycosyl transferase family 2
MTIEIFILSMRGRISTGMPLCLALVLVFRKIPTRRNGCGTYQNEGTQAILKEKVAQIVGRIIYNPINRGKGAALRSGFAAATGDIILVQDAHLEYSPEDYPVLLQPIVSDKADVVFDSRFMGAQRSLS